MKLPKLLKKPNIPENLPKDAKWLAGEGAGSWFVLTAKENDLLIQRFSPKGNFECENIYPKIIDLNLPFKMDYPSHCSVVTIVQENEKIRLVAKLK